VNRFMVRLIFALHMVVGFASYVAVMLLIGGAVNLLISSEGLSFWTKGMLFGLVFFAAMYAVNHVTNRDGFCFLTDLENFYRGRCGMPRVGRFVPRFWETIRSPFKDRCRKVPCVTCQAPACIEDGCFKHRHNGAQLTSEDWACSAECWQKEADAYDNEERK
jgi:hypothetical protein